MGYSPRRWPHGRSAILWERFAFPRMRKLLLHAREIERLTGKTKERGLTLVPLKIYFKNGRAKVELGLARGKKLYDKRETLRRKVAQREVERSIKSRH